MYKNFLLLLVIFTAISCKKEDNTNPPTFSIIKGGMFILNEGNFSTANSSLSYYNPGNQQIENSLFYKVNNVPLGDVAQSITLNNQTAFVVVNNSGLIYGINTSTLQYEGKINNLVSPREIIFINDNKAYVSDLYSTSISIVDPINYNITGSIEVGKSTDCMVKVDNKVFAANWSGYNQSKLNNTIMVIDMETDILIDSIIVGKEPNSLVTDKDGKIWVLCSGGFMNDELPSLWQINPVTHQIEKTFHFEVIMQNPENLCGNGNIDSLFFTNDGVFAMSIYDNELPKKAIVESDNRTFYTLGIDPTTSEIYVSDAINYDQNGIIYRYGSSGNLISSFNVGIIPGDIAFNY